MCSSDLMQLLAEAYERNGDVNLAEEEYGKAVAKDHSPDTGIKYAEFLLRYGKLDEADRQLTDLSAAAPPNKQRLTEADLAKADLAIEAMRVPDKNSAARGRTGCGMGVTGFTRGLQRRGFAWRKFLAGGALGLGVCLMTVPGSTQPRPFTPTIEEPPPGVFHGNTSDNLADQFQRQAVYYRSQHPVGTIIVETRERHLYLIESETRALRYGIGVGREGFTWSGLLQITAKQ